MRAKIDISYSAKKRAGCAIWDDLAVQVWNNCLGNVFAKNIHLKYIEYLLFFVFLGMRG